MNLEGARKLVNGVIENEFNHIQEFKELQEVKDDPELSILRKKSDELYEELCKIAPDFTKSINELDDASSLYWSSLCKYYFKMGVIAGATNLKFLEDVSILHLA